MSSEGGEPKQRPRDPDFIGAEAAMRKGAKRARQRAEQAAADAAAGQTPDLLAQFREFGATARDAGRE